MSEPFRRTPTGIAVELPAELRRWLLAEAEAAGADVVTVDDPVHRRLLGPIDPTADHDDPLIELQRQLEVEGPLERFVATAQSSLLSEEQAEDWIRALQLMLAAAAARHSVHDEDDVAGLAQEAATELTTLQAAISLLIDVLDA
jgi:hypothetical protein